MRIVDWPQPIRVSGVQWLSGPMARNSGSNTAMDGAEATFSGIGDALAFRYDFSLSTRTRERRERGFLLALHGGANWARVKLTLGDIYANDELGVQSIGSQPWSNGQHWANGLPWAASKPVVEIAATINMRTGIVRLKDQFWGHKLGLGDAIGFFPFYFGAHFITEVIEPGEYRVWPRLRKEIAFNADPDLNSYATLEPVMLMKTRPSGHSMARGLFHPEGVSVDMHEVHDYYARDLAG